MWRGVGEGVAWDGGPGPCITWDGNSMFCSLRKLESWDTVTLSLAVGITSQAPWWPQRSLPSPRLLCRSLCLLSESQRNQHREGLVRGPAVCKGHAHAWRPKCSLVLVALMGGSEVVWGAY